MARTSAVMPNAAPFTHSLIYPLDNRPRTPFRGSGIITILDLMDASDWVFALMVVVAATLFVYPWLRVSYRLFYRRVWVNNLWLIWAIAGFFVTWLTFSYFLNADIWLTDAQTVFTHAAWWPAAATLVISVLWLKRRKKLFHKSHAQ